MRSSGWSSTRDSAAPLRRRWSMRTWSPSATPVSDAQAVLRMQHAHQLAVLDRTDATLDDIRGQLTDPDLDPASPVVLDDAGRVVGCGMVFHGSSDHVELDVVVDPDGGEGLFVELLRSALELAGAGARARGHRQVRADQGCYRQDTVTAEHLAGAGFSPATSFHRLRRELDDAVEVHVPDGVVVQREDDETDVTLRRAHRLHMSTFAGHFGFEARPYEQWLAAHRARSGTGPLWFAEVDGSDVAFLHETDQFLEDQDAGYVWRLGVESSARGRGVAKALLLSAFAGMRERGRTSALLHVDAANATGATRLYEAVGMRPVVVIDVWRCMHS
jgi:mycothiol synthase